MTVETPNDFGINVAGFLRAESGSGESGRSYANALRMLGIQVSLNNFSFDCPQRQENFSLNDFTVLNPFPVNLILLNPPEFQKFLSIYSVNYINNKYNIGIWRWDLLQIPDFWSEYFIYFNEIWVESNFVYDAVKIKSPIPVVKIPPFIQPNLFELYKKENFGINKDEFVFLNFFDFYDTKERKNPEGIIRSFQKTFKYDEPVRLIIKTTNGTTFKDDFKYLNSITGDSRIDIIDGYLTENDKNGLISVCDCYCSLHRSIGFGHTLIEAMMFKKPVIATAWSGNTDFMNDLNSYPVNYKLVELQNNYGHYVKGQIWAEPDENHTIHIMREIYENFNKAINKGYKGYADTRKLYGSEDNLKNIHERLKKIDNFIKRSGNNYNYAGNHVKESRLDLNNKCNIDSFKGQVILNNFNLRNDIIKIQEANNNLINQLNASFERINSIMGGFASRFNIKSNPLPDNILFKALDFNKDGLGYTDNENDSMESFDYLGFENLYRGSENEIKERQKKYLQFIKKEAKVIDIACGRGEFLEIMNEYGCYAAGVDINPQMVDRCRSKGLNAVCIDALKYIDKQDSNSVECVFSAQFIEHLDSEELYKFFLYSFKILRNDGVFIAETINPYHYESMLKFHFDITHAKPIFPETAIFLCHNAGFKKARIFYHFSNSFTDVANDQPDYAVVAWK